MAKLLTTAMTRLTSTEKTAKAADAAFKSMLSKAEDAAGVDAIFARIVSHYGVLRQQGDGEGKRFSGAKSHNFADQLAAFTDTVVRGNIVKVD